jgi:pyruvate dehydrogenase E2 component (dihydrolipoamide acetyltransferase)
MGQFVMPSLGPEMEAGTLVEWLVKPGDTVKKGDIVAIVDTEKASIDIEVFEAGVIERILVPVGEKVPVGTPLAVIGTGEAAPGAEAEAPAPPEPKPEAPPAAPAREKPEAAAAAAGPGPAPGARVRISPAARKRAEELGLDIAGLEGSGPGGAIELADVEAGAAGGTPAARPAETAKAATPDLSAMRRAIAAAMSRSKREIPHYYLSHQINLGPALDWLAKANAERPITERLLPAVLLLKAVALAVREVPEMNGFCIDGQYRPSEAVHVGMAIALRRGGGLVAPAIHDTDKKSLVEVMNALQDLVGRVKAGRLRSSEISDPTITLTSLGDRGVDGVFGVIYPPQVSIVGFGTPRERPWASGGMIGAAPVVMATLAADHRVSDGHRGALFLAAIDRLLQEPEKLA